jgi:hypothetical protein
MGKATFRASVSFWQFAEKNATKLENNQQAAWRIAMDRSEQSFNEQPFFVMEGKLADEISMFVTKFGGQLAKHIKRVKLPCDFRQAVDFGYRLLIAEIDLVIFLTACGTQRIVQAACAAEGGERLINALRDATVVASGPLTAQVLYDLGIEPKAIGDGAAQWRNLLATMDVKLALQYSTVAIERTASIHGIRAGLEARGVQVIDVPTLGIDLKQRFTIPKIVVADSVSFLRSTVFVFEIEQLLGLTSWLNIQFDVQPADVLVLVTDPQLEEFAEQAGYAVRAVVGNQDVEGWSTKEATDISRFLW